MLCHVCRPSLWPPNPPSQLLQKTGQIERTVDREFADEEAKYKTCVSPLFDPLRGALSDEQACAGTRRNVRRCRRTVRAIWMQCEVRRHFLRFPQVLMVFSQR